MLPTEQYNILIKITPCAVASMSGLRYYMVKSGIRPINKHTGTRHRQQQNVVPTKTTNHFLLNVLQRERCRPNSKRNTPDNKTLDLLHNMLPFIFETRLIKVTHLTNRLKHSNPRAPCGTVPICWLVFAIPY